MIWSRSEQWMLTGDDKGYLKYWQANMNNVKMFQGHTEAIRGLRYYIYHHLKLYITLILFFFLINKIILNTLIIIQFFEKLFKYKQKFIVVNKIKKKSI